MRDFTCETCGARVFFENSSCERCGSGLAYARDEDRIVSLEPDGTHRAPDGSVRVRCVASEANGCTWLAEPGRLCSSCLMTRTRPADQDDAGLAGWRIAERWKRHLLRELDRLGFRLPPPSDETALRFDLLSETHDDVVTGHAAGTITINLSEGLDSERERVRIHLGESYRTMLGHLRHEAGHYLEWLLLEREGDMVEARELFGDEREDYQSAVDSHYSQGPPAGWEQRYISAYATMHPYEDFAETWAHYLHIQDTLETAVSFGLIPAPDAELDLRELITGTWIPLATAGNMLNRSMGQEDLYPFAIPDGMMPKLEFVDRVRQRAVAPGHAATTPTTATVPPAASASPVR